jgi:hypothetical protein
MAMINDGIVVDEMDATGSISTIMASRRGR